MTKCQYFGPSFTSEGVQTLFFNEAAGHMQKIWSGDNTSHVDENASDRVRLVPKPIQVGSSYKASYN